MIPVTKQEFYAAMGGRDVHPSPQGTYDPVKRDYRTEWKLRDGRIIGESFGAEYKLAPDVWSTP